jgi:hypothetical protein
VCRLDLSDSGEGTVVVYCEGSNEHSISVTCGEFFFFWLREYKLLKKHHSMESVTLYH